MMIDHAAQVADLVGNPMSAPASIAEETRTTMSITAMTNGIPMLP
jgi:hypothetical protein